MNEREGLVDLYLSEKSAFNNKQCKRLTCPVETGGMSCKQAGFKNLCYRCNLITMMGKVEKMKKAALQKAYSPTSITTIERMISPPPTFSEHQNKSISPAVKLPRFHSAAPVRSNPRVSRRAAPHGKQKTSQLPTISPTKSFEDEIILIKTDLVDHQEQQPISRATTASPVVQWSGDRSGLSTASSRTTEMFLEDHQTLFKPITDDSTFTDIPQETATASGDLIKQYYATTSSTPVPAQPTGSEQQQQVDFMSFANSVASELSCDANVAARHGLSPISSPTVSKAISPVILSPVATGARTRSKSVNGGQVQGQGQGQGRGRDQSRDQSRATATATATATASASPSRPSRPPSRSSSPNSFSMFEKLRPDSPFSVGRLSDASFRRYNERTNQNYSIR